MIGIYKITSPSGRVYIGQSNNICKRKEVYKNNRCYSQNRIYNSILKYGFDNHKFEVIEECEIEKLNEREREWQDFYNVIGKKGLNCQLTNTNEIKRQLCVETKNKISNSKKGVKLSDEHKNKISEKLKGKKTKPTRSLLILDLSTGVFYNSITEYCNLHNLKHTTIYNILKGKYKNEKFNNLKLI